MALTLHLALANRGHDHEVHVFTAASPSFPDPEYRLINLRFHLFEPTAGGYLDQASVSQELQEIEQLKNRGEVTEDDISLWKYKEDKFKGSFSTKETWKQVRVRGPECAWSKCVWFSNSTPKYSFMLWLTMLNRLSTGDRMLVWNNNADTSCSLCTGHIETRQHLFFDCQYSGNIWSGLVRDLLAQDFTTDWGSIVSLLSNSGLSKTKEFLVRYAFQTSIHCIWRERNNRRHGKEQQPYQSLLKFIDKTVRNKLTVIRQEGKQDYEDGFRVWFGRKAPAT